MTEDKQKQTGMRALSSSSHCSQPKSGASGEKQCCDSWDLGLGQPVSCSMNSSSPDYKVLHRAIPIARPISFMEGHIVKMQLISFYHGNENITVVGKENRAGGQRDPLLGHRGHLPTGSWGPRASIPNRWLSWVRFGRRGLAGGSSRHPEEEEDGAGRCTGSGTVPPSDCV